jgi:predicted esterase
MPRDPHRDQPIFVWGATLDTASAALVMVHGRGASVDDMRALSSEIEQPNVAYIAPAAAGHTWYPFSLLEPMQRNESYLSSAMRLLERASAKASDAKIPGERVALLGFSQGACVAVEFAARHARRYGAVIGLSGGLMGAEGTPRDYKGSLDGTPVFLGCGDVDPHIPKRRVDHTADVLAKMGAVVDKRIYAGMGHTVNADEIAAVRELVKGLAATGGEHDEGSRS